MSADIDVRMMRRALALAALGRGTASPNPLVGAVVARGARVLGQGFHRRPGEPHAEAVALRQIRRSGGSARGATLYTNLEPCCHTGRTPPCVREIAAADVGRVVASMRDPNPRVDGGGFRALRAQGIEVEVGLLRADAAHLNEAFIKTNRKGLPFVTLKAAASLDGRIATPTGDSKWITSSSARRHARLLRAEHDAVLVGIETVLADDPRLDPRPRPSRANRYLRIVLDGALRLPTDGRLVRTARQIPVSVFCGPDASPLRRRRLVAKGVDVEPVPRRREKLDLATVLRRLADRDVTRLLVEGGGAIHGSFLDEGLADRVILYLAPRIFGGTRARAWVEGNGVQWVRDAHGLRNARWARVGDSFMIDGYLS